MKTSGEKNKEERLSAALRANLRRRKLGSAAPKSGADEMPKPEDAA